MPAWDTAQSEVALKYDPQQSNIQRQLDSLKAQTAANEAGLQQFGTGGRTGINDVYNTLNSLLTGNRATSAQEQQVTGQQIGNVYDTGAQYQSAVANASRQRLAALAAQVGAGAGGELQVLQPFEEQQQGIQGALQLAKANALENQKGWAGKWDQILGQGINIGEQTRADRLAKFESELLNLIGQNKVTGLEGENELTGKLGDIMQARQNDLIASFERLQQQEWERSFQQAQLDQQAASENAKLAMQKYGIDAQSADSAASRAAASGFNWKDMMNATIAWEEAQGEKEWRKSQIGQSNLDRAMKEKEFAFNVGNADFQKWQVGDNMMNAWVSDNNLSLNKPKDAQKAMTYAQQLRSLGFDNSYAHNPVFSMQAGGASGGSSAARSGGGYGGGGIGAYPTSFYGATRDWFGDQAGKLGGALTRRLGYGG